jgi:hypothetical protein
LLAHEFDFLLQSDFKRARRKVKVLFSAIVQQLRKENERIAVLESKIEELFYKYGINSNPTKPTDKP